MVGEQPLRIGILVSPTRTQETAQAACAALIALEHVSSRNGTVVRQFSQIRRSLNISGKVYDICGKDPYVCDLFGQGAAPETRLGSLQALEDAVGSKACDEQGAHDRGVHGLVGPVQAYSYEAIAMVAALHGIPLISPSESSLVLGAQGRAEGQQDSLDHSWSLGGLTIYNDQYPASFLASLLQSFGWKYIATLGHLEHMQDVAFTMELTRWASDELGLNNGLKLKLGKEDPPNMIPRKP